MFNFYRLKNKNIPDAHGLPSLSLTPSKAIYPVTSYSSPRRKSGVSMLVSASKTKGGNKMEKEKLALRIEKIRRALEEEGIEADEEKLKEEFQNYLKYDISPEEAEIRMLRKRGITLRDAVKKKIGEIGTEPISVSVSGKIVSINSAVSTVDGEERKRYYGIIGDDTGTIPFSAWNMDLADLSKGDSVEIEGAFVREWNGNPQLRITRKTKIEKTDEDFDVKFSQRASHEAKLADISEMDRVSIKARILSIEEREITVRGERRTIYSGIMADETAKVQFTAWKDFGLRAGDIISADGAYVRSWKGVPQINLDEGMSVEKIEEEFPSMEDLDEGKYMKIEDAEDIGGMTDVMFEGIAVQIRKGSGLIFRCPICRRVLQDGVCQVHGEVEGVPDLRIKAVIDDGTGAVNTIIGKALTEKVLNKDIEKCLKEVREKMDKGIIGKQIESLLELMPVRIRGNIVSDDNGHTLIATDIEMVESDPVERARYLIEEWGV